LDEKGYSADGFTTQDDAFDKVKNEDEQPYCFAVYFETFDVKTHDYKVQFSFGTKDLPDTNLADYNELVLAPDTASWGLWFDSGACSLYIYITEFIARAETGTAMDIPIPLYVQEVGYSPMKSNPFTDISPLGIT